MQATSRLVSLSGPAACLLLFGAAWLLLPRDRDAGGEGRRAPAVTVCLVDVSASMLRVRPEWLRWVRRELAREARAAAERGEEFAVVSYAGEVATSFRPAPPRVFEERLVGRDGEPFDPRLKERAGTTGTRLADALSVAQGIAAAAERRTGRAVVLGAGAYTGRDPAFRLHDLRRSGVAVSQRPPPGPSLPDLALLDLSLPQLLEAGAPLPVRVRLHYAPEAVARTGAPTRRARLTLELEDGGGGRALSFTLDLPPGGGPVEAVLDAGPAAAGRTFVRGRVNLVAATDGGAPPLDPVPENDRCEASTRAEGELVIGVAFAPDKERDVRAWLTPSEASSLPGVQWVFVPLAELPRRLDEFDALVTFDLAPGELPRGRLRDFVQRGGGWLASCGWRFLADWVAEADAPDAAAGDPLGDGAGLAALLPLVPAPLDVGPRDVVLIVDGSGSMAGEPFETVRRAALDLVAATLPTDRVSLRFFRATLGRPALVKERVADGGTVDALERRRKVERESERAARRLLKLEVPDGSTFLMDSLEAFVETPYENEVLALLLTDGEETNAVFQKEERAEALVRRLSERKRRLVVIAVGEDAHTEYLSLFVAPGDALLRAESFEDLQRIFRREVTGGQLAEDVAVSPAPRTPGSMAFAIEGPRPEVPLASLERLVRAEARPAAEVLWQGPLGEPVLAVARHGAGRTAQFASLPVVGWAGGYRGQPGLGEPRAFGALLRWLARRSTAPDKEGRPRVLVRSDGLALVGLDGRWPPRIDARVVDAFSGAELARLTFTLPGPPAPQPLLGFPPTSVRWCAAEASAPWSGEASTHLRIPDPEPGRPPHLLPLTPPLPDEFAHRERRIALATGEAPDAAPGGPRSAPPRAHPAGMPMLACGLGLLLLHAVVALRSRRPERGGQEFPGASR